MRQVTRRDLFRASRAATAAFLAPLRSLAEGIKPITIRDVDIFPIDIPVSEAEHEPGPRSP